jgi:hypothetical protein
LSPEAWCVDHHATAYINSSTHQGSKSHENVSLHAPMSFLRATAGRIFGNVYR